MGKCYTLNECGFTNNALAYRVCDRTSRIQTNADRIRAMTDDELAEFLIKGKFNCLNVFDCSDVCKDFKKGCAWGCKHKDGNDMEVLSEWLKSEAKE